MIFLLPGNNQACYQSNYYISYNLKNKIYQFACPLHTHKKRTSALSYTQNAFHFLFRN
jgi:hypothetical protein